MSRPLSRRVEGLWYGGSPLAALLQPLAWLFARAVRARRALYRRGLLRTRHPGIPVIVVGNITVGGSGKTPVVAWLVGRLQEAGLRPAVISRGYGAVRRRRPIVVTSSSSATLVGDEPLLLARRTGARVVVGADRLAAAALARAQGADVIVADDGLQHYALGRDLEIVVIDGERRLGNGRMLPAGPLREPPERLAMAALVLVNGAAPAGTAWLGFRLRMSVAVALNGEAHRELREFAGRKAWVVAGIGNPGRFCADLRARGIDPVAVEVADHGATDLASLRRRADWPILMTEKDAVKYPACEVADSWYVPVEVEMAPDAEAQIMSRVADVLRAGRARD